MKIFKLDEQYEVVCNWEKTRNGFRHIAVLHSNGTEVARAKCVYYNRTWESYEYESVLIKIICNNFPNRSKNIEDRKLYEKFMEAVKYENIRRQ